MEKAVRSPGVDYDCRCPDKTETSLPLALIRPFDIKVVYTDNNTAYQSRVTNGKVVTGKKNTEKIERKHLSLRT
jgi:IS1 family transposase